MPAKAQEDTNAFIDNYLEGWDDDDPFRSPSPEPGKKKNDWNNQNDKKRKTDALGIDEQIDVTKKARAPAVKLDEKKLLSEKGIPKLRKMAPRLKLKGKGHEFSDAARLLSFYQEWLDDLYPKATFLDALAMVEKTGHKVVMRNERLKWIDEGRPKSTFGEDDEHRERQRSVPKEPTRIAPVFEKAAQARATTPANDDLFGDNIYDATPRAKAGPKPTEDVPDDDDLDALMAEAEASAPPATFGSIFGGGAPKKLQQSDEPDDDDLDALMAEAEAQTAPSRSAPKANTSIFGNGGSGTSKGEYEDDDDLDALMADANAQSAPKAAETQSRPTKSLDTGDRGARESGKTVAQDEDDLDALMADKEAAPSKSPPAESSEHTDKDGRTFEEDEEAMAEMEGLW